MACSTKAIKICALFWDTILALFSLFLICIGTFIAIQYDLFLHIGLVLLGLGVVELLIVALGSSAAYKEKSTPTKIFAGVLLLLAAVHLVAITLILFLNLPISGNFYNTLDELWGNPELPLKTGNITNIAHIEQTYHCCGKSGPSDYQLAPKSCYYNNVEKYTEGCKTAIGNCFEMIMDFSTLSLLVALLLEVLCAAFAYLLSNSILNRARRCKYYST